MPFRNTELTAEPGMSQAIDFYFDFSSPYGYLGAQRIETLGHAGDVVGQTFQKYRLAVLEGA